MLYCAKPKTLNPKPFILQHLYLGSSYFHDLLLMGEFGVKIDIEIDNIIKDMMTEYFRTCTWLDKI